MIRNKIWVYATRNVPECSELPTHLFLLKCLLHPVQMMYWKVMPYDAWTDVWDIEGIKYSGAALRLLANADGLYRIKSENGIISLIPEKPKKVIEYTSID